MKMRLTDEQIVRTPRLAESRDEPMKDPGKRHDISEQTFERWRNRFGGVDVADAGRLKGPGVGARAARTFDRCNGWSSTA